MMDNQKDIEKENGKATGSESNKNNAATVRTEVPNAHASGDGSLKRSDEEQNRFPGTENSKEGDQY